MNIKVLAPDVNESISGFTPVDGKIRFGLSAIKNVGESTVRAIIDTRTGEGSFESISDFCTRVDSSKLNRRTFESLIKSGAFASLEPSRAKLMNSLERLIIYTALKQKSSVEGQHSLFDIDVTIPPLKLEDTEEWDEKVLLQNEMVFMCSAKAIQKTHNPTIPSKHNVGHGVVKIMHWFLIP